jgi:hypothetical protein
MDISHNPAIYCLPELLVASQALFGGLPKGNDSITSSERAKRLNINV